MRSLWEQSSLYATNLNEIGNFPALPRLSAERKERRFPEPSDRSDSDNQFLKRVVEPAFESSGHARIDVIRDDAFGKPILLPPLEKALYDEKGATAQWMPSDDRCR